MKKTVNKVMNSLLTIVLILGVSTQYVSAKEITNEERQSEITNLSVGTSYFIDSKNGDDTHDGMSEENAFATLSKINSITLKPGDHVYLKKGSIFNEQFKPKGIGSVDAPIIIDSYGDDESKPVINGGGKVYDKAANNTSAAVLIENMEYVKVNNLEVTNDDVFNQTDSANDPNNNRGTHQRRIGIHITINEDAETFVDKQRAWKGIEVKDCYIHDVDGDEQRGANKVNGGIGVEVFFRNSNEVYPYFDGVTLDSNTIEKVDRTGIKGIRLTELTLKDTDGGDGIRYNAIRATEDKNQAGRDFVVKNNDLSNIGGDGILIDSSIGAVVERNVLYDHTKRSSLANAGIWCWNTIDALFQYNESYGGPTYNQDGCSYDCDYNSAGTIFQYNYSHDTPMGFMLLMGGNQMDIVRYNISQDDGMAWRHFSNGSTTPSYIYNNVFYYDGAKWEWSKSEKIQKNYEFYNNVFYNYNDSVATKWGETTDWQNTKLGNNVVYEASGKTGVNELTDAIHNDPKFKSPGTAETKNWKSLEAYQVEDSSPLINKGSYVYLDTSKGNLLDKNKDYSAVKDFYGNSLFNGAPDIGVHETTNNISTKSKIESNATYRIMVAQKSLFLQNNDNNKVELNVKPESNQEVVLVNVQGGYKIKLLDSKKNTYMFLTVQDGVVSFSEDTQSVWQIEDNENGLFKLYLDDKALSYENNGIVMQDKADSKSQEFYLQFVDSSKAYNVGGGEVEGYSADQKFDELESKAGNYGTVQKVSKDDFIGAEEVYGTALTGESFGYKMPVEKGSYNVKLNFLELENIENRTFDIIVNGDIYAEQFVIGKTKKLEEIGSVYPKDGYIDIQFKAAYNTQGVKTNAILNGILLERSANADVNMSLNCGSTGIDGLSGDTVFPTNGSGYYGESSTIDFTNTGRPTPDGGMPSAMETAREGNEFGYKFKAQPGNYRVKLLFNDGAQNAAIDSRVFDIFINGELVSENFDPVKAAGGNKKGIDFTINAKSVGGLIDIKFVGKDGKKALVNAIVIDAISKQETRPNILLNAKAASSSQESDSLSAKWAIDGNQATRWGSGFKDNQWIKAELDKTYMIDTVFVDWTPGAYSTQYHIEVSMDGTEWNKVSTVTNARSGLNVITFSPVEAKYVRVYGEKRNDVWGMSITELEAFGQEVKGAAAIVGNTEKNNDQNYSLSIGVEHIYKRYTRMNVKLKYDKEKAEYIGNDVTNSNDKLVFIEKDINKDKGEIQYVYELKSSDAFENASEFLKMDFKAINNVRSAVDINIEFSDAAAHLTSLPEKTIYIKNEIGKTEIEELIKTATEILDKADIGRKPGQFTQAKVDEFKACIKSAQLTCDNNDESNYATVYTDLDNAISSFKKSVIVAKYNYYYKDYSVEKNVDFGGSKSNATIIDGKLNVNLQSAAAYAFDNQAPLIDEGTFIVKFTPSNINDQIRFDLKNTSTSRIEIGHENGNWFWGGANGGEWGNFPNGSNKSLKLNQENTVKIIFDKLDNGQTSVSLWVNGQSAGTFTKQFSDEKGNYRFWTRSSAKTLMISEVTYTNSPLKTIKTTSGTNGSTSEIGDISVFMESDKTFKFKPDDGYEVDKVLVDNKEVSIKNNQYTFEFINKDHTLDVQFREIRLDKAELQSLYNQHVDDLQESYTDESWAVFAEALKAAKLVLDSSTVSQEEVDLALDTLSTAVASRKIRSADYSEVDSIIATIPKDLSNYTDETIEKLNKVVQSLDKTLDITQQKQVDSYVETIKNAINDLTLKKANYTEVDKILANVPKDLTTYTEESVKKLNQEINAVIRNLDITKQKTVDGYVVAIHKAIENLVKKVIHIDIDAVKDNNTGIVIEGKLPNGSNFIVNKIADKKTLDILDSALKQIAEKYVAFDLSIVKDGIQIQPNGKLKVTMPIPNGFDKTSIAIFYIDNEGNKTKLDSRIETDYIVFEVDHLSIYALVQLKNTDVSIPELPKTNDNINFELYTILALTTLVSCMYLIYKRKSKEL